MKWVKITSNTLCKEWDNEQVEKDIRDLPIVCIFHRDMRTELNG